jgi:hypothetical protein
MTISFDKLAGNFNLETQFISDTLDVVNKSCWGYLCGPAGEGSFDRADVAMAVQIAVTTRTRELQEMDKTAFDKLKANVEAMAAKFSRMGVCCRKGKDLSCETLFERAMHALTPIALQKNALAGLPATGRAFTAQDFSEANARHPNMGAPGRPFVGVKNPNAVYGGDSGNGTPEKKNRIINVAPIAVATIVPLSPGAQLTAAGLIG